VPLLCCSPMVKDMAEIPVRRGTGGRLNITKVLRCLENKGREAHEETGEEVKEALYLGKRHHVGLSKVGKAGDLDELWGMIKTILILLKYI